MMDAPSASPPKNRLFTAASVLVVDDVEDNREVLTDRLAVLGIDNVTTAADGREALELIAGHEFDLVLLDLMMPNVNGIQVLETLREEDRLATLPVIMVSASNEIAAVVRCIELGAEDYLTKPVNPTLLRARIGATLEKKLLRDTLRARLAEADHELRAARELQLGMVPEDFNDPTRGVSINLMLEPAHHVGGDLCDYFAGPSGPIWFAIGDVSGKGPAAAIFMARTWACLHAISLRGDSPGIRPCDVLTIVNRELCEANAGSMFTTIFLGRIDPATGLVTYANAGHIPPFHLDRDGGCRQLEAPPRPPVGAWPEVEYPSGEVQLAPGDSLFAYSDGLTEAIDSENQQWGDEKLRALLAAGTRIPGHALLAQVLVSVCEFTGYLPQTDDIAALLLRWKS
jgi:sigma-B regulation protein RsbU (phosphoserine phosphatase)